MSVPPDVHQADVSTRYGIQVAVDVYRAHTDTGWAYTIATSNDDARARITAAYQTKRGYTPAITQTHVAPPEAVQAFIEDQLDIIDGGGTLAPLHADLLRLLTERTRGDIPADTAARLTAPPPAARLFTGTHVRHVFGGLTRLWLWCLAAIAPAVASTAYWVGHFAQWWTAVGWDRQTDWFANRGTFAAYVVWGLAPVQTLWFLGWVLATSPWVERHVTMTPYVGPVPGGVTMTGKR